METIIIIILFITIIGIISKGLKNGKKLRKEIKDCNAEIERKAEIIKDLKEEKKVQAKTIDEQIQLNLDLISEKQKIQKELNFYGNITRAYEDCSADNNFFTAGRNIIKNHYRGGQTKNRLSYFLKLISRDVIQKNKK